MSQEGFGSDRSWVADLLEQMDVAGAGEAARAEMERARAQIRTQLAPHCPPEQLDILVQELADIRLLAVSLGVREAQLRDIRDGLRRDMECYAAVLPQQGRKCLRRIAQDNERASRQDVRRSSIAKGR